MAELALDRIDKHILNLLQQDSSISNVILADQVGLSPPACLRRVNRLREAGVICAEVVLVDPKMVGYQLNIIVEVELERDRPDLYDQFKRKVLAAEEVSQCYQVTGEVDFVLVVVVPDMQAYEVFIQRVLYTEANMRKFRSLISLNRAKFETAVLV